MCCFKARLRVIVTNIDSYAHSRVRKYADAIVALYCDTDTRNGARTAILLKAILDGDWTKPVIEHRCLGYCCKGRATIDIIEEQLLDIFIGGACPMLSRSRWKRFTGALAWNGLPSSVHGIFEAVVPVWRRVMKDIKRPPKIEDFKLPDIAQQTSRTAISQGWDKLVGVIDYNSARSVQEPGLSLEDAVAVDADGKMKWTEWQANIGKNVEGFASSHAAPLLAGLTTVLGTMNKAFDRILLLSGVERFDSDFKDIVLKKMPGQSRLLAEARGNTTKEFWNDMQLLFRDVSSWQCISPQYRCSRLAGILFCIAAKGCGAVHFHLCVMSVWYPVKTFLLTGTEDEARTVFDDRKCTRDTFSEEFLEDYPTLPDTQSVEAQCELGAIQLDARCDTIPVEQGHADDRRTAMMHFTNKKSYADVVADGLIRRQMAREKEYAPPEAAAAKAKPRTRRKDRRGGRKRMLPNIATPAPKAKCLSTSRRNIRRRERRKEKDKYDKRTFSGYNLFFQEQQKGTRFRAGTNRATVQAWKTMDRDTKRSYARRALRLGMLKVSRKAAQAHAAKSKREAVIASLPVDHKGLVQQAYDSMDTDLDLQERLDVIDQAGKEQGHVAIARKREFASAASAWSHDIASDTFAIRLANKPTTPMFRKHATSFPGDVFELVPKMSTLLRRAILHSSGATRKTLDDVFVRSTSMVCTSTLDDLGDVPVPRQSLCYYARRCVCSSVEGKALALLLSELTSLLRWMTPAKSHVRTGLARGDVVPRTSREFSSVSNTLLTVYNLLFSFSNGFHLVPQTLC